MFGIVQPHLLQVRAPDDSEEPVDQAKFVMVDHAPDQADADRRDRARKEPECSVNSLQSCHSGVDEHDHDEGDSDLSNDTGDNQVDIVAECLPEYTVPEQLLIIGQAGELFGRAALPFKEAVHKCCDKRHKYRKDKERYRDNQVQYDCPAPWFNGRQHDRSPIYMETAVPPALAGGTALSLNSFPANVPADSADQEASVSV